MDCLFCKIIAGEIPSTKVYENDWVYAFRDINPQAPVHILVIPKRVIARLGNAEADDAALLGHLLVSAAAIAHERGIDAGGFRTVINSGRDAGETVPHLHVHLLGGRALAWPPG